MVFAAWPTLLVLDFFLIQFFDVTFPDFSSDKITYIKSIHKSLYHGNGKNCVDPFPTKLAVSTGQERAVFPSV